MSFLIRKYGEMQVNKYREMNDSRVAKGIRVIQREGMIVFLYRLSQYLKRKALTAAAPFIITILPKKTFVYKGKKLYYFFHKKSLTWTNERAIEIPIAVNFIKNQNAKRILEVGAVLHHYYPSIKKEVIDKFEKGKGILNIDVLNFNPKEKYDCIVSISTLEHVGYDDDAKDPYGTLKAIQNLKKCLGRGGKMLITLPLKYNKNVDKLLNENKLGFTEEHYYVRRNMLRWEQTTKENAMNARDAQFHADAIVIGEVNK